MMKKFILVGLASALLIGCTTASKATKVSSNVQGLAYNSVASSYTPMLTTASLLDFDDGSKAIHYRMETYKRDNHGNIQAANVTIPNTSLEQHLALFNKFLDWDTKAKSRSEQFDKEIGRAKTINGYSVYTFHSGNKHSNFLDVCFVLGENGSCMIESITFDVLNVKYVIDDLTKFKSGGFKHVDTSIYN